MATQNPRRQSSHSWMQWGCAITVGATLLLLLGVVAYVVLMAQPGGGTLNVQILSPAAEEQVRINAPVLVAAEAANRAGVSRVEVYADGALIVAQDSERKPGAVLRAIGDWIPLTPGRHALMARGYGLRLTHTDSHIIYVDVLKQPDTVTVDVGSLAGCGAHPTVDSLAACLGTTPDDLEGSSPDLAGLSGSDPVPPGAEIHAPSPPGTPPESSPPPAPAPGVPAAPTGLAGTPDCTGANLHWNRSPDAQTYSVYRPTTTLGTPIADGLTDTTYWDTSVPRPGTYQYAVASVRDGQEGPPSAMFTAPSPEDCPVFGFAPGTAGDLVLTVAMVHTDDVWEGLACYLKINAAADERIPEGDSIYVLPAGSDPHYYDLSSLPAGGRYFLDAQPLSTPVTLGRECQAKTGLFASSLGSFSVSEPREHWDGTLRHARGDFFDFYYCLGPRAQPCTPVIPGGSPTEDTIVNTGGVLSFTINAPTHVSHTAGMDTWPYVDQCGALPIEDRVRCTAAEAFRGRERITWDWEATPTFPESSLTSYTIERKDLSTLQYAFWTITQRTGPGGSLPKRLFTSDSDLCDGSVQYSVQANIGELHSAWSSVSFPTARCAQAADVTVTFDTLQLLGPLNDQHESVAFGDDHLEVYGDIHAYGPSTYPSVVKPAAACGISLGAGGYPWSGLDLLQLEPWNSDHGAGRNVFRGRITDSTQPITFGVSLREADSPVFWSCNVHETPWLTGDTTLGPFSIHDWSVFHQSFEFRGGTAVTEGGPGEGQIIVTVRVDGAPAP